MSTANQKVDLQKDNLQNYARKAGFNLVGEYLDVAVSGRKEGRPKLRELMKASHNISSFDLGKGQS